MWLWGHFLDLNISIDKKSVDKSINQSKTVTTVGNKKELVAVKRNNLET